MNLTRIQRLLKVLGNLQTGRGYNAPTLAEVCGVSRRTIFRDIETLRSAGVPLRFDEENQRYHIPDKFYLPPTNFTAEEALAVIVLCHELGGESAIPFFEPVRDAAMKLESCLPSRFRDLLRQIAPAIRIRREPKNALQNQRPVFDALVEAIALRRSVRFAYDSFTEGELIRTRLSPYQLLFSRRSWYVIGRSTVHRAIRTFNIGRIENLEETDTRYQIPKSFTLKRYLRNAWHMIPASGPDHLVQIRFEQKVARNVAEVTWHPTQDCQMNADGSLDFRVSVSGLNEISWWILGYGDQAEVIRPQSLREIVAQHAENMTARYRNDQVASKGGPSTSKRRRRKDGPQAVKRGRR